MKLLLNYEHKINNFKKRLPNGEIHRINFKS